MQRLLALFLLCAAAPVALAAESHGACAGFIDSVPTTITTQGTWCLRKDLATAVTSGAAITVATNNVTIDCNGFKLGGLAAGVDSQTHGILAMGRLNATVRNCAIRGFRNGVRLLGEGSGGHLVEDNRIDQSLTVGIVVTGKGNLVQRNRVFDTGTLSGIGILAEGDILDNAVDGLVGSSAEGIKAYGAGTDVGRNVLRNFAGSNISQGIALLGSFQTAVDNQLLGPGGSSSVGIVGNSPISTVCRDNRVAGFYNGMVDCGDQGGNVIHAP